MVSLCTLNKLNILKLIFLYSLLKILEMYIIKRIKKNSFCGHIWFYQILPYIYFLKRVYMVGHQRFQRWHYKCYMLNVPVKLEIEMFSVVRSDQQIMWYDVPECFPMCRSEGSICSWKKLLYRDILPSPTKKNKTFHSYENYLGCGAGGRTPFRGIYQK